jgi:hypothetical protein
MAKKILVVVDRMILLQELLETKSVTWQQMLLQMKSGQENMMT